MKHERDIYICDEPQAFADAIETVLGSEEKQKEMCLHSKDVLKNTLQPEEQKRLRLNLYTTCLKPQ